MYAKFEIITLNTLTLHKTEIINSSQYFSVLKHLISKIDFHYIPVYKNSTSQYGMNQKR